MPGVDRDAGQPQNIQRENIARRHADHFAVNNAKRANIEGEANSVENALLVLHARARAVELTGGGYDFVGYG